MKRTLTILFFAIALLFAMSAAPVFAGDDQDGSTPPCTQCDGGQVWSG
jgi:hypothetical protein